MIKATGRDHYPCIDYPDGKCPDRFPGCQSVCVKMLCAQLEHDARKKAEWEGKQTDIGVSASHIGRINRNMRKKSRQI